MRSTKNLLFFHNDHVNETTIFFVPKGEANPEQIKKYMDKSKEILHILNFKFIHEKKFNF
jgi:hypothetical protein